MKFKKSALIFSMSCALLTQYAFADDCSGFPNGVEPFNDSGIEFGDVARDGAGINGDYGSAEARRIAENVFTYQKNSGGWHKNEDDRMHYIFTNAELQDIACHSNDRASIDNRATRNQMLFLSKVHTAIGDSDASLKSAIENSFLEGVDFLLDMQYDNGGFPQEYPIETDAGYYRFITYNDGAMIGVLELLKDLYDNNGYNIPLSPNKRDQINTAYQKGIGAILASQYLQGTQQQPTIWGQQHNEVTYQPETARSYELPSLAGAESAAVVKFLADVYRETGRSDVLQAIEYASLWYAENRIVGHRVVGPNDANYVEGPENTSNGYRNKYAEVETQAGWKDSWARMADLNDNTQYFVERGGVIQTSLNNMALQSYEDDRVDRRNNYSWYSDNGYDVFELIGDLYEEGLLSGDIYQAEDSNLSSGTSVFSDSNADGGQAVNYSNTGTLTFTNIDGGNGGKRMLLARYALNGPTRRGEFRVNGGSWQQVDARDEISSDWGSYNYDMVAFIDLIPGNNQIEVRSIGNDFANLDLIAIYTPSFGGAGPELDISQDGTYTVALQWKDNNDFVQALTDNGDKLSANVDTSLDAIDEKSKFVMTRSGDRVWFQSIQTGDYIRTGSPDDTLYADANSASLTEFNIFDKGNNLWALESVGEEFVQQNGDFLIANKSSDNDNKTKWYIHALPEEVRQAENATLSNVRVTNDVAGAVAQFFADFDKNNSSVIFSNIRGYGKTAQLEIRYASKATRTAKLLINGVQQDFTMRDTGSWSSWVTDAIPIYLEDNGANEIEFKTTSDDDNYGNLDQITIVH